MEVKTYEQFNESNNSSIEVLSNDIPIKLIEKTIGKKWAVANSPNYSDGTDTYPKHISDFEKHEDDAFGEFENPTEMDGGDVSDNNGYECRTFKVNGKKVKAIYVWDYADATIIYPM